MSIKIEGPIPLLFLSKRNKNNRIYTRECIDRALKEYEGKEILGVINAPTSSTIDLSDVAFTTSEHFVQDDILWAKKVKLLTTPAAQRLIEIMQTGVSVCIRPVGTGVIRDGFVEDYKIHGMMIVMKGDDSFS